MWPNNQSGAGNGANLPASSRNQNRSSLTGNNSYTAATSASRGAQAASMLNPALNLALHNLRQSRYSPSADDFLAESNSTRLANANLRNSQTFQSPARGTASFIPRAYNSASRYSILGNINRRNRSVSQHEADNLPQVEDPQPEAYDSGQVRRTVTSNEVDHSVDLSSDFAKFLFEAQLADIKIHVSRRPPEEAKGPPHRLGNLTSVTTAAEEETSAEGEIVVIPAHRMVLASRCQYFFAKFCGEWGDGNALVAKFPEFSEHPMREFLRYLYTGKLRIELGSVMGIMRIASYFNMEELVKSCKMYLRSGKLNAFDLCILYCEVREGFQDFDDMRSFLTSLIPKRMDNRILCRVLKRIWVSPRQSSNLETVAEDQAGEHDNATTATEEASSTKGAEKLLDKAKAVATQHLSVSTAVESKTIKFNTCLSDDQDSDTIKFEDAMNDSQAVRPKGTSLKDLVKKSQGSANVVISSAEAHEEEKKGGSEEPQLSQAAEDASPGQAKHPAPSSRRLEVGQREQARMISSNDYENEEKRDLQQILMEKLQLSLPVILQDEQTREELLQLPREALELLFSNSETCLSEFQLFEVIERRLLQLRGNDQPHSQTVSRSQDQTESQPLLNRAVATSQSQATLLQGVVPTLDLREYTFLKEMLKFVRLPLINMKQLVTSIKFSGFFDDQAIFEALQFQVAKEVLANQRIANDIKYEYRGIRSHFDLKHYDLSIQEDLKDQSCLLTTDAGQSFLSHQKVQKSLTIKRDRVCQSPDDSTISAIMGEDLPLHGIHYWELKLKTENPANLKKVFVGLCNKRDNSSLEDVHQSKSAILLNCFDSTFWNNGQQVQVFSNKYIKIRQPMEDNDIIRIAIDLRHANHFERFWAEQNQQQTDASQNQDGNPERNHARSLERERNDRDHLAGRNSTLGSAGSSLRQPRGFNNGGDFGANSDRFVLRDRYRALNSAGLGGAPRNPRENINLLLNANNEVMFFNSPCKFHFAFNGSEFHEGVDLNLISLDEAPTNLCVSLPEHLGVEVLLSRAVYFCDWALVPKEPFLLN